MIGTQSLHFTNFNPPILNSIWKSETFVSSAINLLTLGLYTSITIVSQKQRIEELRINQKKLMDKAFNINKEWAELEKEITNCLDQSKKDKIEELVNKSRLTKLQEVGKKNGEELLDKPHTNLIVVALKIIDFIKQEILNLLTVGLYGIYSNHIFDNEIKLLEAQNIYLKEKNNADIQEKDAHIQKVINLYNEKIKLKAEKEQIEQQLVDIGQTDPAKAYQEISALQAAQQKINQELTALKAQKALVDTQLTQTQNSLQTLQTANQQLNQEKAGLTDELSKTKKNVTEKESELTQLQAVINQANQKGQRVQTLEIELAKLQSITKNPTEVQKTLAQLGPIPPKYTPIITDGEIEGAEGITDVSGFDQTNWSEHAKRYNGKRTASEVIETAFLHSFKELRLLAKHPNSPIKFTKCLATQSSPAARAVYRRAVYNLIENSKLHQPTCHGYELLINNQDVIMVPSCPERVMRNKYNSASKQFDQAVEVRFTRRDDFTPDEDVLDRVVPYGVNPIGIKWILARLTTEEKEYLLRLLLGVVTVNDDPGYTEAKQFVRAKNERAQLVATAYDLICDQATAIEKKFGENVFIKCWQNVLDTTDMNPAFVNDEDKDIGVVQVSQGEKQVEWVLDEEGIIGKQKDLNLVSFFNFMLLSQLKYKVAFNNMKKIIAYPEQGQSVDNLDFDKFRESSIICHKMINSNALGLGGQRCLFSNLLAILMVDTNKLTNENANNMRKAMANYLEKLKDAKAKWSRIKSTYFDKDNKEIKKLDEDSKKLKELADLHDHFDKEIRKSHQCSISNYQEWLRGQFNSSHIDINNMNSIAIELAAFTFSIKIGVLGLNLKTSAIVNEEGRIMPEFDYYGPNTKECLLMGCNGKSYYGLFPKIKLDGLDPKTDEYADLKDLQDYWNSIDMSKST